MNPSAAYLSLHAHFRRVCTNVRRCRRPLETLTQYQPGRGARHVPGQSEPDTWVPMDGSYKQYTFQNGMDLQAAVPPDAHPRHIRWVQDDEPSSPINNKPELTANGKSAAQNRWIAYDKLRGQYSSAMEHAVPEQFWVDKSQCRYMDESGQIQNPTMADCAQSISAVKAIAIAQSQGQKIYTINQSNAATALPKLSIGGDVGAEIRNAIQAGKELTFHERQISAHGWTGYGYVITDPDTGAGAYLIEGKGNGGVLALFGAALAGVIGLYLLPLVAGSALMAISIMLSIALHVAILALIDLIASGDVDPQNILAGSAAALSLIRALATLFAGMELAAAFSAPGGVMMGLVLVILAILGFSRIK